MNSVKAKISTTRSKNDKEKEEKEVKGKQSTEMQKALDKFLGF